MNRLQQAMKINAAIDHLYATEDGVTVIMQFNAIYDALLDIDELIEAAAQEELDEEVEFELTSAGHDAIDSYDMEHDFNPFSPSVGTSEGTALLQGIFGRTATGTAELLRAPVGERVYMEFSPTSKPSYVQTTIAEAFEPCGAD